MTAEAGKGSKQRPTDHKRFTDNYDLIFGKKSKMTEKKVMKFGAEWCSPCKQLSKVLSEIIADNPAKFVYEEIDIDSDGGMKLAKENKVSGVPTLVVYEDGIEVSRLVGMKPKSEIMKVIGL